MISNHSALLRAGIYDAIIAAKSLEALLSFARSAAIGRPTSAIVYQTPPNQLTGCNAPKTDFGALPHSGRSARGHNAGEYPPS